jgi:hypothetical protein
VYYSRRIMLLDEACSGEDQRPEYRRGLDYVDRYPAQDFTIVTLGPEGD